MSLNKPVWKLRDWIDIDKLNWINLSLNPNAIKLLENNPEKIDWCNLSLNPNAIKLLEKNQDKIEWYYLSKNKNAIKLLKDNPEKIEWNFLASNPSIFELDYEKMRINNLDMYEDIIKEVMKPSRVFKNPDYDYLEELFGD
jgi:hypothetical protein